MPPPSKLNLADLYHIAADLAAESGNSVLPNISMMKYMIL